MSDQERNRAREALALLDEMSAAEVAALTEWERYRLRELCHHWHQVIEPKGVA